MPGRDWTVRLRMVQWRGWRVGHVCLFSLSLFLKYNTLLNLTKTTIFTLFYTKDIDFNPPIVNPHPPTMNADDALYADVLIERYNLDNLEGLSDHEIRLLWREISNGMKLINFEKLDQAEFKRLIGMKPGNVEKLGNLCKLVNMQKLSDRAGYPGHPGHDQHPPSFYKCDYCPKKFSTSERKITHTDSVHKRIRHECPECQTLFADKRGVLRHMVMYHNISVGKSTNMAIRKFYQGDCDDFSDQVQAQVHQPEIETIEIKLERDVDSPPAQKRSRIEAVTDRDNSTPSPAAVPSPAGSIEQSTPDPTDTTSRSRPADPTSGTISTSLSIIDKEATVRVPFEKYNEADNEICLICKKSIRSSNMKRHLDIHKGTRYQCPECPATVGRIDHARSHLVKVHHLDPNEVAEMKIDRVTGQSKQSGTETETPHISDTKEHG